MTAAPSAKHLWGARHAAERVSRFTAGKSFEDYRADELLRSAVERQLGTIGEAPAALRRADPALAADIPEPPRVVAFRNILVHGCATADDWPVRGVVERDLARLPEALARLLPLE